MIYIKSQLTDVQLEICWALVTRSFSFFLLLSLSLLEIINGPSNGNVQHDFALFPSESQQLQRSIILEDWSGDKTNVNVYCLRSVYLPHCLAMPYWYSRDEVTTFSLSLSHFFCCWRKWFASRPHVIFRFSSIDRYSNKLTNIIFSTAVAGFVCVFRTTIGFWCVEGAIKSCHMRPKPLTFVIFERCVYGDFETLISTDNGLQTSLSTIIAQHHPFDVRNLFGFCRWCWAKKKEI